MRDICLDTIHLPVAKEQELRCGAQPAQQRLLKDTI